MKKHTLGRAAGFVAAIGATTALVAGGVSMTGAYFQDTESGTLSSTTGEVDVAVDSNTPLTSNFADLMPGEAAGSNNYTFTNTGTEAADLYLKTEGWTIGGALAAPRAAQTGDATISNGEIRLRDSAVGPTGGASFAWEDVSTYVQDGDTMSFEWRDDGDASNPCAVRGASPRMYIRTGTTYNTWDHIGDGRTEDSARSCGTDLGNGWRKVVATFEGIAPGAAGKVSIVSDEQALRTFVIRNVTMGGDSLTSASAPVSLCDGSVKSGFFEARIKGLNPPHNTGWFKVCAPGANQDRKSTRLNSSHSCAYRMPSSAGTQ